jgi:hypothetical protein
MHFEPDTLFDTAGLPPLHATEESDPQLSLVFLRQPVVTILDKLGKPGFKWLRGAPGTGKSQVVRLWACSRACQGERVVLAEVRRGMRWLTVMEDNKWTQWKLGSQKFKHEVETAAQKKSNIVVLDGVTKDRDLSNLGGAVLAGKALGVVASSGQGHIKDQAPDLGMPGWTLEEDLAALSHRELFDQTILAQEVVDFDSREPFIKDKYDVAGLSSRLMFEKKTAKAQQIYDEALQHQMDNNEKRLLLFGELPKGHEKAQNVLVQSVHQVGAVSCAPEDMKSVFASKYVLQKLRAVLDLEDVKKLHAHCKTLHRVIEGWAWEELVLKLLEKSTSQVQFRPEQGGDITEEKWLATRVVTFDTRQFFEHGEFVDENGVEIKLDEDAHIILRPNKTNNASWDALLLKCIDGIWEMHVLEITLQPLMCWTRW